MHSREGGSFVEVRVLVPVLVFVLSLVSSVVGVFTLVLSCFVCIFVVCV